MELRKEQQKAQEIYHNLIVKSWEDNEFKEELIANPATAIKKITGKTERLASGKKLIVTDQSNPHCVYLNIPEKPSFNDLELTEEQLEFVAGGGDPLESWLYNNVVVPVATFVESVKAIF